MTAPRRLPAAVVRLALWALRPFVARAHVLSLRHSDWIVAYRPCGCLAGAISAAATDDDILDFAAQCAREGLLVAPRDGDVYAECCAVHWPGERVA